MRSHCLPAAGRGGPTTAQPGCSRRVGGGKGLGAAQRPQARGRDPRGEPTPGTSGPGSSRARGGVGGPRTTAALGPVGVLSAGSCRAALSSSRLHAPLPFTSFRTAAWPPPTPPWSWLRSNAAPRSHPATSPWAGAAQFSPVQPSPAPSSHPAGRPAGTPPGSRSCWRSPCSRRRGTAGTSPWQGCRRSDRRGPCTGRAPGASGRCHFGARGWR